MDRSCGIELRNQRDAGFWFRQLFGLRAGVASGRGPGCYPVFAWSGVYRESYGLARSEERDAPRLQLTRSSFAAHRRQRVKGHDTPPRCNAQTGLACVGLRRSVTRQGGRKPWLLTGDHGDAAKTMRAAKPDAPRTACVSKSTISTEPARLPCNGRSLAAPGSGRWPRHNTPRCHKRQDRPPGVGLRRWVTRPGGRKKTLLTGETGAAKQTKRATNDDAPRTDVLSTGSVERRPARRDG